jgi:hypothetical protein
MSDQAPANAKSSPSTSRNRGPIQEVLKACLPDAGVVLEIAAGAGEHAAVYAAAFPNLHWQPTDPDSEALTSIAAWRDHVALPNLRPPLRLDASDPDRWPVGHADAIVNINMIHISPWMAAEGLFAGAGRLLPRGGALLVYGPYIERDVETAPSNLAFDASLKSRNPAWGIRRLDEVTALAGRHGLGLFERVEMPANNLALVFRKL